VVGDGRRVKESAQFGIADGPSTANRRLTEITAFRNSPHPQFLVKIERNGFGWLLQFIGRFRGRFPRKFHYADPVTQWPMLLTAATPSHEA
jgi:hypothetical protein